MQYYSIHILSCLYLNGVKILPFTLIPQLEREKRRKKTRSLWVNTFFLFKGAITESSSAKENLKRKSCPFCSRRTKLSRQKPFRWCITSQPRALIMKRDNIISDTSDSKLALLHRPHCSLTLYSSSFETWYSSSHSLFTLYLICISYSDIATNICNSILFVNEMALRPETICQKAPY